MGVGQLCVAGCIVRASEEAFRAVVGGAAAAAAAAFVTKEKPHGPHTFRDRAPIENGSTVCRLGFIRRIFTGFSPPSSRRGLLLLARP